MSGDLNKPFKIGFIILLAFCLINSFSHFLLLKSSIKVLKNELYVTILSSTSLIVNALLVIFLFYFYLKMVATIFNK